MDTLVIDSTLEQRLVPTSGSRTLCNDKGKAVAVVVSPEFYDDLIETWLSQPPSAQEREEIRAAVDDWKKNGGGYTTAQVLEYLKSLDNGGGLQLP